MRRLRGLRRRLVQGLVAVLATAMLGGLALLPLRRAVGLAGAVAGGLAPLFRGSWRLAHAHLAAAFPERTPAERRAIARAAFTNLGRSFAELAKIRAIRRRFDRYVEAEGMEHLRAALARGTGVLAITGHVGNWELLAAYCAWAGLPVSVIGRRLHSPMLNRMLVAFRARTGVTTIVRESPGSSRAILRTLRANRILALLIDQDTRGPAVFVPFFGRLARTPSGAAALARRSGVPVVLLFISRRPDGGHVIRVEPPRVADAASTLEEITAGYTEAIEAQVRARPDEWVWWHRRWRRQPSTSLSPLIKP